MNTYEQWFHKKVVEAMNSNEKTSTHDDAMAKFRKALSK